MTDGPSKRRTVETIHRDGYGWCAKHHDIGVASQGETEATALEALAEAIQLHTADGRDEDEIDREQEAGDGDPGDYTDVGWGSDRTPIGRAHKREAERRRADDDDEGDHRMDKVDAIGHVQDAVAGPSDTDDDEDEIEHSDETDDETHEEKMAHHFGGTPEDWEVGIATPELSDAGQDAVEELTRDGEDVPPQIQTVALRHSDDGWHAHHSETGVTAVADTVTDALASLVDALDEDRPDNTGFHGP